MRYALDGLQNKTVLDSAGRAIGEVDGLYFDAPSWHVDIMRVKMRRDAGEQAGMSSSLFKKPHIDVPTSMIQSVGDAVLLAVPLEQLRGETPHAEAPEPVPMPR